MDIQSLIPDIFPHYVTIGHTTVSQSLIAGVIGTMLFVIFVLYYNFISKKNPHSSFSQAVALLYDTVYAFLADV